MREAITPELLRVVEAVAEDPVKQAERRDYALHMFAMYLLAQFREKRAYPLLVKIFKVPGETAFDLAGDTVTERLSRIAAGAPSQRLRRAARRALTLAANTFVQVKPVAASANCV